MYWFDTVETIPNGVGFSHYNSTHLIWIGAFIAFAAIISLFYKKADTATRKVLRYIIGTFIVLDEVFKWVMLFAGGNESVNYLPFHLCSINIFLIAFHMWKPTKLLDEFLYLICIPAAIIALVFPTWTELPVLNFMHIHSFTVHILLATYPIMLTVGGDIKPSLKRLTGCVLLLLGMATVVFLINLLLDTNFMFLMYAEEGNPLLIFEELWGSHLLGFPVLLPLVMALMYGTIYGIRVLQKNNDCSPVIS